MPSGCGINQRTNREKEKKKELHSGISLASLPVPLAGPEAFSSCSVGSIP